MKSSTRILISLLLVLLLATACRAVSDSGPPTEGGAAIVLSDELLGNLEYKTLFTKSGTAKLENGNYSEPADPDSTAQTTVTRTAYIARGPVADVANAAALVLVSSPGGSGTFYELALVIQSNGPPKNVDSFLLGERVRIDSVRIEDRQILVDMYTQGAQDPICCPSQHVVNTYRLNVNELVLVSSEVIAAGIVTVPIELTGRVWEWASLVTGDPQAETNLPEPARYTLAFEPGEQLTYQADCLQGRGTFSTEGELIHLDLGQPPEPDCQGDSRARQFLQYLASAVSFKLEQDTLTLELDINEDQLVFEPGEAIEMTPSIKISSPAPGSLVDPSQLLTVTGSASGLTGASLGVQVLDESGSLLAEEPFLLQGENVSIGAAGSWSVSLSLEGVSGSQGQLVAYASSPQDGTWITQASVAVQFVSP